MEIKFRDLKASEIDVRINQISEKGCSLLLYKDARVDMNILDETVGPLNWQRRHTRDNANCIVSIWDSEKQQWIEKEDTGTESYTEKDKGLASDSFKRVCVNIGIGRELYTAPYIYVSADKIDIEKNQAGKWVVKGKFIVSEIKIENKEITELVIMNTKTQKACFTWKKEVSTKQTATKGKSNQLTAESKEALNSAIEEYRQMTGQDINLIMQELKKEVGKSHAQYTEQDVKTALKAIAQLKTEYQTTLEQ